MFIFGWIFWNGKTEDIVLASEFLKKVGYQAALIAFTSQKEYEIFSKNPDLYGKPELKFPISIKMISTCKGNRVAIPLFPLIILKENTIHQFAQNLNHISDLPLLRAATVNDQETAENLAKDTRIDILIAENDKENQIFTKGVVSLARQSGNTLAHSLSSAITASKYQQSKIFRNLFRLFNSIKLFRQPNIIFTEFHYPENKYIIRGPRELIAILKTIFKIPEKWGKEMLSNHWEKLILLQIKRVYDLFIEPGVEIVDIKNIDKEKI